MDIYRVIEKEHDKRKNMLLRKNSKAEKHFARLLNDASIFYTKEKCCYDKSGNWCYIDFFIPLYNIAIEIDGAEHNGKARKEKDIKKETFLREKRNIVTVRYSNKECLAMDSVSIIDIVKKAGRNKASKEDIAYKKKQREEELEQMAKRASFDVCAEVFLYDKDKDTIYKFKDLYMAKHSTGVDYKYLIHAMEHNKDINASKMFILSNNREELERLVNEYYEYIWNN